MQTFSPPPSDPRKGIATAALLYYYAGVRKRRQSCGPLLLSLGVAAPSTVALLVLPTNCEKSEARRSLPTSHVSFFTSCNVVATQFPVLTSYYLQNVFSLDQHQEDPPLWKGVVGKYV